jgi:exoribonuclease-2
VVFGVHIAAPGLAITPDSALDKVARDRLSTVYMPGWKLTMLPDEVVQAYTLTEGRDCPAVSLYVTLDEATLEVRAAETKLERVPIVPTCATTSWTRWSPKPRSPARRPADYAFAHRTGLCLPPGAVLKARREVVRGKPETFNRPDYNFKLDRDGRRRTHGTRRC